MRLSRFTALVAAVAVLLSACGSGDEESPSSQAAGGGGDITCEDTAVRFHLSFFPNSQHVGYLVAANRGFYEEEGLNVEMVPGGPTVNPPLQLAQGNVDIAQVDFPDAVTGRADGAPITYVAQTYQQNPLRMISLPEVPLSEPADLAGLKVGVQQAGGTSTELRGLLEQGGLSEDDVEQVTMGFGIEDLLSGLVDVMPMQTFFHIAQLETADIGYPDGVNELDPNEYGVAVANQGIAVNDEFLADNRDAVVCFLRASLRGWQAVVDDPESALEDVAAFAPEGIASEEEEQINIAQTVELATVTGDGSEVSDLLQLDDTYLEESKQILLDYGILGEDVPLDEVVDATPLEDARQSAGA